MVVHLQYICQNTAFEVDFHLASEWLKLFMLGGFTVLFSFDKFLEDLCIMPSGDRF